LFQSTTPTAQAAPILKKLGISPPRRILAVERPSPPPADIATRVGGVFRERPCILEARRDEVADPHSTWWHTLPHRRETRSMPQEREPAMDHIGIDVHKKEKPDLYPG
jgi:hypothetical protein